MNHMTSQRRDDRGNLILVVVFIATAIAGLAALSSGRVVAETRHQRTMEEETRAFNSAYAQIHMAMNVITASAYDEENHNLAIRAAMNGDFGGTIGLTGTTSQSTTTSVNAGGFATGYVADAKAQTKADWLADPEGVEYGFVENTDVRCYRARDYIRRLQKLRGDLVSEVDPEGLSDSYFVVEAAGRVGRTVRLVSALIRENEPFSSFVFFQNRATLGVSGAPRGLIHSNDKLAFYFPNGSYLDSVSAVNGFDYLAGATPGNTNLRDANPAAAPISLETTPLADLKAKADLFTGLPGLDAEISFSANGRVRIQPYTPPRIDLVTKSRTYDKWVGYHYETVTRTMSVKVGTQEVQVETQVVDHYEDQPYTVWEQVQVGEQVNTYYTTEQVQVGTREETYTETQTVQVGTTPVTKYRTVTVQVGTQQVAKTRQDPIYSTRTVTKTRQVRVWQPYDVTGADGGTAVGGGGAGELGEWVWVTEAYQVEETYISGYTTVTYYVTEPVYETRTESYIEYEPVYETRQVERTRTVAVYEAQQVEHTEVTPIYELQEVTRFRQVPVYTTVLTTQTVDVYEDRPVEVQERVDDYVTITETWTEEQFFGAVAQPRTDVYVSQVKGSTIYIDGRVLKLGGDLNGRLTLIAADKVRLTGSVRYVDAAGRTAMLNGNEYTKPYERNPSYTGHSVLGVIAERDVLLTSSLPAMTEINGTLMSRTGRVGIDGFWAKSDGDLVKDSSTARKTYLTAAQERQERAYDQYSAWRTRSFVKDSLRRIGGVVSNNRILETYVAVDNTGMTTVAAGYKRGNMRFDINLLFNPPPNFVEVPRPVMTYIMPVLLVRNNET